MQSKKEIERGAPLRELSVGEKTTWGDWKKRHPRTLVLSVQGRTHEPENHYASYFGSERTFRNRTIPDDRLAPKQAIYAFRLGANAYAARHEDLAGGRLFRLGEDEKHEVFLFRRPGAPILESTVAFLVPAERMRTTGNRHVIEGEKRPLDGAATVAVLTRSAGVERLGGFDTFWYTWAAVHEGTRILE